MEATPSARDRAMATVLFYAGLRLSELAALDMADVAVSARRGRLGAFAPARATPTGRYPSTAPPARPWTTGSTPRVDQLAALAEAGGAGDGETPALWLSRSGRRMTSRAVDLVVRRLAAEANLELSADVLRHTFVTTWSGRGPTWSW